MDISQLTAPSVAALVTFAVGAIATAIAQHGSRSRLKSNIEMLKGLPEQSQVRDALLASVDRRIGETLKQTERKTNSEIVGQRVAAGLLTTSFFALIGGFIYLGTLAPGGQVSSGQTAFIPLTAAMLFGTVAMAVGAGLFIFLWIRISYRWWKAK